jgi:tRNA pseudouridine32 synthase/23S rRNA pseudouridine746 synthase
MDILYQDEALLVINKPAGLSTLPDGYEPSLPHVKKLLEPDLGRLWIVHRLDKATSGVLLLARTAAAHKDLNTQFEKHRVAKVYHALVFGKPSWRQKSIRLPLRPNGDRQHRTIIDQEAGKPAITHFKVLERFEQYCLVQAIPETGRTHQIRAHLTAVDLFILGDRLYSRKIPLRFKPRSELSPEQDEFLNLLAGSMALHARSLEVSHPTSGERLNFIASYPEAFAVVLKLLQSLEVDS